jgi:uncharacterized protein (UPF0264 family)
MPKLLVSVRSAEEADAALDGGASIIDVKEPSLGSLGRASAATIMGVVARVAGRVPVSAALGDLTDARPENSEPLALQGLSYVKWGLAGSGSRWHSRLLDTAKKLTSIDRAADPVAVAYADWQAARAPDPDAILTFVRKQAWPVFLLDTWQKDGRTLLDRLSFEEIRRLCETCRRDRIQVALAGSLTMDQISELLPLEPDIFAVRGAVCLKNDRTATVDPARVGTLVELMNSSHANLES